MDSYYHGILAATDVLIPASYQAIKYKLKWLAKIFSKILSEYRSIITMTGHEVLVEKLLAKKPTS